MFLARPMRKLNRYTKVRVFMSLEPDLPQNIAFVLFYTCIYAMAEASDLELVCGLLLTSTPKNQTEVQKWA